MERADERNLPQMLPPATHPPAPLRPLQTSSRAERQSVTGTRHGVMILPGVSDLGDCIDGYLTDLSLRNRSERTLLSYRRLLNDFAATVPGKCACELELRDYERFLGRWVGKSPSTLASGVSLVKSFSRFLYERGLTPVDVAYPLKRPRRLPAEDLPVVTVSGDDVAKMLLACEDWQEIICLGAAVYLGWRRAALCRARRADADLVNGTMSLLEKGGKVVTKPIPDEYLHVLREADAAGLWPRPEDYLIPNRRPKSMRTPAGGERSDKVIWSTVKRVAARAGVRAHVHALRAAFAVQYDEQNPGRNVELKELMGHRRLETTLVYLRRKDRAKAMETVRGLSWGAPFVFESQAAEPADLQAKAHTGFEPVLEPSSLWEPLRRKLDEFRTQASVRS